MLENPDHKEHQEKLALGTQPGTGRALGTCMIDLGSPGLTVSPARPCDSRRHLERPAFPALISTVLGSLPSVGLANLLLLLRGCRLPNPPQGWTGAGVAGRPGSVLSLA